MKNEKLKLPNDIDKPIRKHILLMNKLGYKTYSSCAGFNYKGHQEFYYPKKKKNIYKYDKVKFIELPIIQSHFIPMISFSCSDEKLLLLIKELQKINSPKWVDFEMQWRLNFHNALYYIEQGNFRHYDGRCNASIIYYWAELFEVLKKIEKKQNETKN
jgi:hypothetical protein